VPQRFEVVEEDCVGCGLCVERAAENMAIPGSSSAAQVIKQPENREEEDACLEASDYCPMGGLQVSDADSWRAKPSAGRA
jgi:ferredoxin